MHQTLLALCLARLNLKLESSLPCVFSGEFEEDEHIMKSLGLPVSFLESRPDEKVLSFCDSTFSESSESHVVFWLE